MREPVYQLRGFIAQLVEQFTGIAEVMDSNPPGAILIFQVSILKCEDH